MTIKLFRRLLPLLTALALLTFCARADEYQLTGTVMTDVVRMTDAFSASDTRDVTGNADASITLSGDTATISDSTRGSSGQTVTITKKGVYLVTGEAENVTVRISDENESGNIYLVLDSVTMTNETEPCILVDAADKVIIQLVGQNSLTLTAGNDETNACIWSRDDLTINGSGSLLINSAQNGVVCKDDLKLTGGAITVNAAEAGLRANDSVRTANAVISITSGKDGVHIENGASDGWFYQESGSIAITASGDGIDVGGDADEASGYIWLYSGDISIVSGSGSGSAAGETSAKGLKCQGDIYLGPVTVNISSADDAVNSEASISVTGGEITLSSSDDGIHADSVLSISGGKLTVEKSYEGLEAYEIRISGGEVSVTASDDGLNAANGSDSASGEFGPWARYASEATEAAGTISISGGDVYVNATGDGLDANGSIYVSGGNVIVEGPQNDMNGALDKGDSAGCTLSITGGTVLALGSSGMAVNFDSGTQCACLVALSGEAGDTVTVSDGSGFSFTVSKSFSCAIYSSPSMTEGSQYTLSAGESSVTADFSQGLYYSDVSVSHGFFGGDWFERHSGPFFGGPDR